MMIFVFIRVQITASGGDSSLHLSDAETLVLTLLRLYKLTIGRQRVAD
jgi:hypothetical protein